MINLKNLTDACSDWSQSKPFSHIVVENFFEDDTAKKLESEFPNFDSELWHKYSNAIEVKKVCNNWNAFPECTYRVMAYLNSQIFADVLSNNLFGKSILFTDPGLNGGGWHIHKRGGKLNTHLDYSLHPKLQLQRKLNIIIYLNSEWQAEWGGHLGLWGNESDTKPGKLLKEIEPQFNTAVIFDTTQNSWHGLPEPLNCPENQTRRSLAVYYLTEPANNAINRGKALFAPTKEQSTDAEVLELIRVRSDIKTAHSVWNKGDK